MNILFYGAGVLGSLYAARLRQAGHDVSILARGQRLADLRAHGIVLEDLATGQRTVTPVRVAESLGPDETYDLIVVLMRKNQVGDILPVLAANRTPTVLFMVNNAAGPEAYVEALGRERVLLGFPGAGGAREGHVVRYRLAGVQKTTLGELDGALTPRLRQIAAAFQAAGFPAAICPAMDAWLKTHVALVSPVANAIYAAGGDIYRLARTRDALLLMIRAAREGFRVLRALGVPITPARLRLLERLPEPLLLAILRRGLAQEEAELMLARHANAARDEMGQLADEFQALARQAGVATPMINQLALHLDPTMLPIPAGSALLPVDWRGVWGWVGGLVGLVALLWRGRRSRRKR